MELIERVIADIRSSKHYEYSVRRIEGVLHHHRRPDLGRFSGLRYTTSNILRSSKPLCAWQMELLKEYLRHNPDVVEAANYPVNVVLVIRDEFGESGEDVLLSGFLPTHEAVEFYWLNILLCAERNDLACEAVAVVARTQMWSHVMIAMGEDCNGMRIGGYERHDPAVLNGLVQLYTHGYLKVANPRCYSAFLGMMTDPSWAARTHRVHLNWISKDLMDYQERGIRVENHVEACLDDLANEASIEFSPFEHIRSILLTHLRDKPDMTLKEFNEKFNRREIISKAACDQLMKLF